MNFEGADLARLDLRFINFKMANLSHANLSGANMAFCSLERTNLSFAKLDVSRHGDDCFGLVGAIEYSYIFSSKQRKWKVLPKSNFKEFCLWKEQEVISAIWQLLLNVCYLCA